MNQISKQKLVLTLYKVGCLKFGEFTLKSGMKSPVYLDLRILVSYPGALKMAAQAYISVLKKIKFDRLAAVPYAALPLVAVVSFLTNKSWIYTRKEVKNHGIKKPIEGLYQKGQKVVVIDDLITTGASKLEVIKPLLEAGLKVKDIVVLVDRGQGAKEQLTEEGYNLHAFMTFPKMLEILKDKKKISSKKYRETIEFLRKTKVK